MGLYDVAMIKDNHKLAAGSITAAYRGSGRRFPDVPVQVEVTTLAEAVEAVEAGADFLLCDNMAPELLREVVAAVGDRAELEATGGLTLETVAAYAATGVDYLSVGGLTHSSPILDIAMDLAARVDRRGKMASVLLCIDIGNTNTVLATFDGDKLVHNWRIKTDARSTADELGLMFRGLLAGDAVEITGVAACSTVPAALRSLRTMLARYYGDLPNVVVEPGVKTGVQLAIDNPKEVGADRVVNTLAAHALYGGPSIVVDFGTTTNFDVISAKGEFLGGAFAPGIEISFDALAARAAQLRKVEPAQPRSVIGKNTVECLQSGMYFGFAGQVDRIVERMIEELGSVRAVIATGGLAGLVHGRVPDDHRARADDHADRAADGI